MIPERCPPNNLGIELVTAFLYAGANGGRGELDRKACLPKGVAFGMPPLRMLLARTEWCTVSFGLSH
jgi:hypothetical protein